VAFGKEEYKMRALRKTGPNPAGQFLGESMPSKLCLPEVHLALAGYSRIASDPYGVGDCSSF